MRGSCTSSSVNRDMVQMESAPYTKFAQKHTVHMCYYREKDSDPCYKNSETKINNIHATKLIYMLIIK